ncbi:phage holin family protein [Methylomonas sp. AM2-LC]|uniref:phage holin family protein n=1 Tax=Methylomonas sp. AM2-LC TaxID=3153301 RepID=UPI003264C39F
MTQPPAEKSAEQTATDDQCVTETAWLKQAGKLCGEIYELGHDHFRLAALETQRAGLSLVTIIVAGVLLAVVLNGIWFALMAVLVFVLIEIGIPTSHAILLAIACSLILILILIAVIRHHSQYLKYPALSRPDICSNEES